MKPQARRATIGEDHFDLSPPNSARVDRSRKSLERGLLRGEARGETLRPIGVGPNVVDL
jgi:hypothetical protein